MWHTEVAERGAEMPTNELIFGLLIVVSLLFSWFVFHRRRHRDPRPYLEPILSRHDLRYVSSRAPGGLLDTGPFPKVEVTVGRPQTEVGGIRGEYAQYRIVSIEDADGVGCEVWAQLEFERFRVRRVRWRAASDGSVPASVRPLLETRTPDDTIGLTRT